MNEFDSFDFLGENIDTLSKILIRELKEHQDNKKKIKNNESAYIELVCFPEEFIKDISFSYIEKISIINKLIKYFSEIEEFEKCAYLSTFLHSVNKNN